jgi:hypothetical protein
MDSTRNRTWLPKSTTGATLIQARFRTFDFELNPFGFSRIVQKTSATLRYDKFNNLRLKYNDSKVNHGGHADPGAFPYLLPA